MSDRFRPFRFSRAGLRGLKASPTLSLNEQVREMWEAGRDVYHLGFGESRFPVHPKIAEAFNPRKLEENYERFPPLRDRHRSHAGELSGGMQRMVELGRTLMADPKIILVDEPTAGLAKMLSEEVYQMLVDLRDKDGMTIILVGQEIRQALKIADYVYVLELGRNKFDGPVEEFTDPQDLKKAFWA